MSAMRPLISCLCCASDARSDAYREICEGIFHQPPRFHRKQWENVYILHMLREAGVLEIGKRGLGFGCGREILVPAFAALGCEVLATDQDAESTAASGWIETSQHSSSLTDFAVYLPRVCSEADFLGRVRHRTVDMNGIPPDLLNGDYDFVSWTPFSGQS